MSGTTASRKGDALRICVVVAVAVLIEPLWGVAAVAPLRRFGVDGQQLS
jgi:hypothetical protein